ncbi:SDR family oxidoreductase [Agarivorans sp. MS3-6]|uniref:SDR family oxidoreductase n=1 Tax=Agarivorans sp. TSD2052 TaxID=2937286 RepID=UPI00200CB650|nr:SDR family oxidoreductase [Agarivorans sp. TSD2052]UPW17273.1 SDR family oxidoreductase [Agarivorans sp. TSD2052]
MNKVAIVTGAGRGIGAATAIQLAKQGYSLCINYLADEQSALAVVSQIEGAGGKAIAVRADVSEEEQVLRLFQIVDQQLGAIDLLINNAGVLFAQTDIEAMTAERINRTLKTNVTGYFLCCREAVKRMSYKHRGKGGVIVNVSSAASRIGSAHEYIDYAASKGAVDTLTIGLAMEVAEQGIRVNGVRPGLIYTQMHASGGEPNRVDRLKAQLPLKRGGTPEDVAEAIVWLSSDKSSYTTGAFIDVSGGR